jgi:ribose transport system ATP-binding protein
LSDRTPRLQLAGIHKRFPGVYALQNVSFDLYDGEVHALLGENGAGKSTLINVIAGNHTVDEGKIFVAGEQVNTSDPHNSLKHGIAVVYQELNVVNSLSIAENVYYGHLPQNSLGLIQWKKLYEDTDKILKEFGFDIHPKAKVSTLSIAHKQMVEIMRVYARDPAILVFDEPTSSLAPREVDRLMDLIDRMRAKGKAIVYISHKLDEVFRISDRITVLRDGQHVITGETKNFTEQSLIHYMVGRKLDETFKKSERNLENIILKVNDLSTDKVSNISFSLHAGEVLGVTGLMGSGRTELAYALYGIDPRLSGTIMLDGKLLPPNNPEISVKMGMGMIPENRKELGIIPGDSVQNNLNAAVYSELSKGLVISHKNEEKSAQSMVDALSIKTPTLKQRILNLSGGNQQKVIVGRWILKRGLKVLIVDEPTRGIDVGAKAEIYALLDNLANQGMAIIVMSSEMQEILSMCDRILVIRAGRISGEFSRSEATQEKLLSAAVGV